MANDFVISTAVRNAGCNAMVDLIDAGATAGTLKIYNGAKPAGPETAITTQTLLATLTFSDPALGDALVGVATADTITSDTDVDATGTAAWFRIADSDGNAIADGTVGTSGSDINFDTSLQAAEGMTPLY